MMGCLTAGIVGAVTLGLGYATFNAAQQSRQTAAGAEAGVKKGGPMAAAKEVLMDFGQFVVVLSAIFLTALMSLVFGPLLYTAKV